LELLEHVDLLELELKLKPEMGPELDVEHGRELGDWWADRVLDGGELFC